MHTQSSRALESQIERQCFDFSLLLSIAANPFDIVVRGALTDSQDHSARAQAVLHILAHADWEATRSAMHTVIVYLGKQDKRMSALIDLRQQVRPSVSHDTITADLNLLAPAAPARDRRVPTGFPGRKDLS